MSTVFSYALAPTHYYPDHPENPERFSFLGSQLDASKRIDSSQASIEQISRVHTLQMISDVRTACLQGPAIIDFAPTFVTKTSFQDALLAAGAAIACTNWVLKGDASSAFSIARPPGHHAEPKRAMGFCIFNNVAIAAREALAQGLERVMIVDYDAHHGNGIQATSKDDERVAYLSMHQEGIYPGSGWIEDVPQARRRIVNVPLPERTGDMGYLRVTEDVIYPLAESFHPQMIFISAGFDAHWNDPLTRMGLSANGFFTLSRRLVELSQEHCDGKIVFVLEGGYDSRNNANGVAAVFAALNDLRFGVDSGDASPYPEPDLSQRLDEVRRWHALG